MKKLWVGAVTGSPAQGRKAGVLILMPKHLTANVEQVTQDIEGRKLMMTLSIGSNRLSLPNIYAPNVQTKNTYRSIKEWLAKVTTPIHLIGGDFNNDLDLAEHKRMETATRSQNGQTLDLVNHDNYEHIHDRGNPTDGRLAFAPPT